MGMKPTRLKGAKLLGQNVAHSSRRTAVSHLTRTTTPFHLPMPPNMMIQRSGSSDGHTTLWDGIWLQRKVLPDIDCPADQPEMFDRALGISERMWKTLSPFFKEHGYEVYESAGHCQTHPPESSRVALSADQTYPYARRLKELHDNKQFRFSGTHVTSLSEPNHVCLTQAFVELSYLGCTRQDGKGSRHPVGS
jgi:hypothetical protein